MKKQATELGMSLWNKRGRMALLTLSLTIGLVCLGSLVFGTSRVRANPAPTIDGVGTDWSSSWQVITDVANDISRDGWQCINPNNSPCYARSGYDFTALWAHYEAGNWYFRLDTDGTPGDLDSYTGTVSNLGTGTHDFDGGPLMPTGPSGRDYYGLYQSAFRDEFYRLDFAYQQWNLFSIIRRPADLISPE